MFLELNLCSQGLKNFCCQHAREEKRRKEIEKRKQLEEERRKKLEKERRELMRQKQKEKEEKKKDESSAASFRVSYLKGFFQMLKPFHYFENPFVVFCTALSGSKRVNFSRGTK